VRKKRGQEEQWGVVGSDKEPLQSNKEKNAAIRLATVHNQWFLLHLHIPYTPFS
jgi:hypothetical protein